eukprot:GGOE01019556.1.p1 GENE.GGOE01019556.1~~GGOE01019556.1.p1  ORF type:complete len:1459 (-),score=437.52 GGOE01019556.1:330-4532(-)
MARLQPTSMAGRFVNCLALAEDQIWAGCTDGCLRVFDEASREMVWELELPFGNASELTCLVAHDGMVFAAGHDGRIYQWDAKHASFVRAFPGHEDAVMCLACRGPILYSGGNDGRVHLWDVDTGSHLHSLPAQKHGVSCLAKAEGSVWVGGVDGTIKVYDMTASPPTLLKTWSAHRSRVTCILFLGSSVWTGALDRVVHVWSPWTHGLLASIHQHQGYLVQLCPVLRKQTWRVWTAANDKVLRIWDMDGSFECASRLDDAKVSSLLEMYEVSQIDTTQFQSKLTQMGDRISLKEDQLSAAEVEVTSLRSQLEDLRIELAEKNAQLEASLGEKSGLLRDVAALADEKAAATRALHELQAATDAHMAQQQEQQQESLHHTLASLTTVVADLEPFKHWHQKLQAEYDFMKQHSAEVQQQLDTLLKENRALVAEVQQQASDADISRRSSPSESPTENQRNPDIKSIEVMLLELKAEILRLSTENQRLANACNAAQNAQQIQALSDRASSMHALANDVAASVGTIAKRLLESPAAQPQRADLSALDAGVHQLVGQSEALHREVLRLTAENARLLQDQTWLNRELKAKEESVSKLQAESEKHRSSVDSQALLAAKEEMATRLRQAETELERLRAERQDFLSFKLATEMNEKALGQVPAQATQHLQTDLMRAAAERDQLRLERERLIGSKDQMVAELSVLQKDNQRLQHACGKLEEEVQTLRQHGQTASAQLQSTAQAAHFLSELQQLKASVAAQAERLQDHSLGQRTVDTQISLAKAGHEVSKKEAEQLAAENARLLAQNEALGGQNGRLHAQNERLSAESGQLKAVLAEHQQTVKENGRLQARVEQLSQQLSLAGAERDKLAGELQKMQMGHSHSRAEVDQLVADNGKLQARNDALTSQNDRLHILNERLAAECEERKAEAEKCHLQALECGAMKARLEQLQDERAKMENHHLAGQQKALEETSTIRSLLEEQGRQVTEQLSAERARNAALTMEGMQRATEIATLTARLGSAEQELLQLKSRCTLLEAVEKEFQVLQPTHAEAVSAVQELTATLSTLQASHAALQQERSKLRSEKEELQQEFVTCCGHLATAKDRCMELEARLQAASFVLDSRSTLTSALWALHQTIRKAREASKPMEKKLKAQGLGRETQKMLLGSLGAISQAHLLIEQSHRHILCEYISEEEKAALGINPLQFPRVGGQLSDGAGKPGSLAPLHVIPHPKEATTAAPVAANSSADPQSPDTPHRRRRPANKQRGETSLPIGRQRPQSARPPSRGRAPAAANVPDRLASTSPVRVGAGRLARRKKHQLVSTMPPRSGDAPGVVVEAWAATATGAQPASAAEDPVVQAPPHTEAPNVMGTLPQASGQKDDQCEPSQPEAVTTEVTQPSPEVVTEETGAPPVGGAE